MSTKITVLPSNKTFYIQGRETLLRAGMREGLNLSHQCMNGSCGECHALLHSGTIKKIRHHDFKIADNIDGRQQFLACCYAAGSDLVIEMQELNDASQIPCQQITTRVSRVTPLNNDVSEIQLKTPRSQLLEFLAGQRMEIQLPQQTLDIGIASCPCDGMNLRIHLDRQISEQQSVIEQLIKGSKVTIQGPAGTLTLNEQSQRPLIFIAFETGFAQIQSLVDHVISIDDERPVYLICLTRSAAGFYRENHCRAWRDVLDSFDYDIVYMPDQYKQDFPLFLSKLFNKRKKIQEAEIYSVIPADLTAPLQQICREHNFPQTRLFIDQL